MSMTDRHRARPRRRQGQAAADLVQRRLPRDRRPHPAHRRAARRLRRPARRHAGARRRHRQRQRRDRRGAPRRHGRGRRLRAGAARAGRVRAAAEGYDIRFVEGDAEALPYADGEFDAVTTIFGSMFAPDHHQAAAELLRVTRPGGTIAVASWTPEGFIGQMFKTVGKHVPPPAGVPRRSCGAPSPTCGRSSAAASRRCRSPSAPSPGASPRRRRSSTPSAPGTARPSRRSPPSTTPGRRPLSRPTSWPWPRRTTGWATPTPSRCRRPTSRPSRSAADPTPRGTSTHAGGEGPASRGRDAGLRPRRSGLPAGGRRHLRPGRPRTAPPGPRCWGGSSPRC